MGLIKNKLFIIFFFLISSCSSIPSNTSNSCLIFNERYLWYKHTKRVEQKWGTPIYVQLAIIKMESDFDWLAKPSRQKIFKVIPFKRPSSSFGYSQAVKGTCEQYKKETDSPIATRAPPCHDDNSFTLAFNHSILVYSFYFGISFSMPIPRNKATYS